MSAWFSLLLTFTRFSGGDSLSSCYFLPFLLYLFLRCNALLHFPWSWQCVVSKGSADCQSSSGCSSTAACFAFLFSPTCFINKSSSFAVRLVAFVLLYTIQRSFHGTSEHFTSTAMMQFGSFTICYFFAYTTEIKTCLINQSAHQFSSNMIRSGFLFPSKCTLRRNNRDYKSVISHSDSYTSESCININLTLPKQHVTPSCILFPFSWCVLFILWRASHRNKHSVTACAKTT